MLPRISKPNLLKLALLALLLGLVLGLRFVVVAPGEAGGLVVRTGYYFVGLNFLLFVFFAGRILVSAGGRRRIKSHLPGLALCLVLTLITHLQEPHGFKVLNDEFALLNMSMAMHHYQQAGLMGQAHRIDGELEHTEFTAGKRSLFFQYLLSLVHGVSGYRPQNAFVLNFLVTGLFFTALYGVLCLLVRRRLLVFSGLLTAAAIPLLPHVATSGGYDLLNATMILLFMLIGAAYMKSPSLDRQSAFVLTALLLGQVRYESILYLLALAGLVAYIWILEKQLKLSWISAISPVFLFIPLMLNAHMFANEVLQDAGVRGSDQAFMSIGFLWHNLKDAARFFFDPGSSILNSVAVSVLCLAGFLFLGWKFIGGGYRIHAGQMPEISVLFATCLITALCFLIMALNFWGVLTDPQATRFALPVYVTGVLCGIWMLEVLIRNTFLLWVTVVTSMALLGSNALLLRSREIAAQQWVTPRYHAWVLEYATRNLPNSTLYVCDGTLGLVAFEQAVLPIEVVNLLPSDLAALVESGMYDSAIVFELLYLDESSGSYLTAPTTRGLRRDRFTGELVAEKQLHPPFVGRAWKLAGWIGADGTKHEIKGRDQDHP